MTGAGRGVGREIALAFARSGFDVALAARTGREGDLEGTAARVRACGVSALPVPMDLLDGASVLAAADRVLESWGRVDVLVNNAYVQSADDDTSAVQYGNYRHQLALIQRVLPAMVEKGSGVVINLLSAPESAAGETVAGTQATSNVAFRRLAAAVNAEYGYRGVRAFNLGPDAEVAEPGQEIGGDAVPSTVVARSAVWLATQPAADRFLDNVVWVPKPVGTLAA